MKFNRVGIYARVSTEEEQNPAIQLRVLRSYAKRRRWVIAKEFVDRGELGSSQDRPALKDLWSSARRREIDIVLVSRFDRFARSALHLLISMEEFRCLGVDFVSYHEQIDTSTPMGKMAFGIISVMAEFESAMTSERIKDALAFARSNGVRLGRPPLHSMIEEKALMKEAGRLRKSGCSLRQCARLLGLNKDAVRRLTKKLEGKKP